MGTPMKYIEDDIMLVSLSVYGRVYSIVTRRYFDIVRINILGAFHRLPNGRNAWEHL